MTRPRSALISLDATPYYHVIARCVRRAFLCGTDHHTGRDFNHRKPMLLERLKLLGNIFAIDIAAFAVMSNHYHLVLHVNKSKADNWTNEEVVTRWLRLHKGSELMQRYVRGETMLDAEKTLVHDTIAHWRERLHDISCFMARLNYFIALRANQEDGCTGRFWEGRFKSQALLDETALLSCMAYVDLNPVRAGIAESLETSDFTSIQARLRQRSAKPSSSESPPLMAFSTDELESGHTAIQFRFDDYAELVHWTGRYHRPDKRGAIDASQSNLLGAIRVTAAEWLSLGRELQKETASALHGMAKLAVIERRMGPARAA